MNKTFGSLFSGGGGADWGAMAAGLTPVFGVEYDNAIADCYERNIGKHVIRSTVQAVDYSKLPSVWLLHMSPVCTSFSVAKANGEETQLDIDAANACARAIRENKPRNVTIENVQGYRQSKSFKIICDTLRDCGYKYRVVIENAANYGVAQTRVRLFVLASLDRLPRKPQPTHQKPSESHQSSLFETRLPNWIGWYAAIEDLLPTLPLAYHRKGQPCEFDPDGLECRKSAWCRGHFAKWQEARLPKELTNSLMFEPTEMRDNGQQINANDPACTIKASKHDNFRAFIVESDVAGDRAVAIRNSDCPMMTVKANSGGNQPKAFLLNASSTIECNVAAGSAATQVANSRGLSQKAFIVNGTENSYGESVTLPQGDAPMFSVVAQTGQRQIPRAFIVPDGLYARPKSYGALLVDGQQSNPSRDGRTANTRKGNEPSITINATQGKSIHSAWLSSGRIVRMNPCCLARFQSFPDSYELPESATLACRIIGNAVTPMLYRELLRCFD